MDLCSYVFILVHYEMVLSIRITGPNVTVTLLFWRTLVKSFGSLGEFYLEIVVHITLKDYWKYNQINVWSITITIPLFHRNAPENTIVHYYMYIALACGQHNVRSDWLRVRSERPLAAIMPLGIPKCCTLKVVGSFECLSDPGTHTSCE